MRVTLDVLLQDAKALGVPEDLVRETYKRGVREYLATYPKDAYGESMRLDCANLWGCLYARKTIRQYNKEEITK